MVRRYVSQLGHQEAIDEVFLASEKQLRPNRSGNLYLQVDLSDRSGSIGARLWNASEQDFRAFENGDYVRVEGCTQLFQGSIQLIATSIARASQNDVEQDDFMLLGSKEIDTMMLRLAEHLRRITDSSLRNLAECFLMDEELMRKLGRAPAGVKNHHAYLGGLLEHIVTLLELALRVCDVYPVLNRDLLVMGVFLHDLGKVDELAYDRDFTYTDTGQLLGHVVMAVGMLDKKLRDVERLAVEPVAEETVLRLKHMIVSHHGQYEFGSPKLPMTVEAVALHQLDNLDAKLHCFQQILRDDPNVESCWTSFNQNLGRKLFKGSQNGQPRAETE